MTHSQIFNYLTKTAIPAGKPVLLKGKPGIGKTDLIKQVAKYLNAMLMTTHPVVSDPTDVKGMPFMFTDNGKPVADFLPFGDLRKLIEATSLLICFIDDLGQAPPAVQAAWMQLLLAREINGHKVSDFVYFVAATNRKEDMAGVNSILEPVKSRFTGGILELEVNVDEWCNWAIDANMPTSLIAFNRLRPELANSGKPSRDLVNTATLRTIAAIGNIQNAGIDKEIQWEVFTGIAGEGFATEYNAFLDMLHKMPNLDKIILNPNTAEVPTQPGILYAVVTGLAVKMKDSNIDAILQYLERLPGEFLVCCMRDAIRRKPELAQTRAFMKFAAQIEL